MHFNTYLNVPGVSSSYFCFLNAAFPFASLPFFPHRYFKFIGG